MIVTNLLDHRTAALAVLALIAGTVSAQDAVPVCPPECKISIGVPDDVSKPPTINHPVLKVDPGAKIEFETTGPAQIIFVNPGKTPFVGPADRPVYWFDVNRLNSPILRIREDNNPCPALPEDPERSECKYMILDRKDFERPPLDPYMIVQ